jgi:KaiC/GvpD/RAD55 family RecA-like ATPase
VQFYGTDESLFTTVASFLAAGLVAGQPAVVIATPSHRTSIVDHLRQRLIDCDRALRNGDLLLLDAEAVLDLFMVSEEPDEALFESNVGRLLEQVINGRRRVVLRAYGEMVDVLWKQGRSEAAIKLEILWNKLAAKYNFALLCGYSMGSFYKQTQQLEEVIALHTNVVAHDTATVSFPSHPQTA